MHTAAPGAVATRPAAQSVQMIGFSLAEYVPTAHWSHVTVPELAAKLPNGHDRHCDCPKAATNMPAIQLMQTCAPLPWVLRVE